MPKFESRDQIFFEIGNKRLKLKEFEIEKEKIESEIKKLKFELNQSTNLNQLPTEVICLIFKNLAIKDILRCELVCQKWNYFVKCLNIQKLVITKRKEEKVNKWFFSNEICDSLSTITKKNLNFKCKLEDSFMINLKQLKIINSSDDCKSDRRKNFPLLANIDFVNKLTNLELLEISKIEFKDKFEKENVIEITITLPLLKYLAIEKDYSSIKLNTPSLSSFKGIGSINNIDFIFPDKITHLYFNSYSYTLCYEKGKFKNLQYFFINDLIYVNVVDFLTNLSKVKELSICPYRKYGFNSSKRYFLEFLEQKKKLNRTDLKLIYYGVLVEDAAQLDNYEFKKDLVKLHIQNYSKLNEKELRWIKEINYSSLIESCDNQIDRIPKDFHSKFVEIKKVIISDNLDDEHHLMNFLKGFKKVNTLKIQKHSQSLSESFFEKLLTNCPQIRSLNFDKSNRNCNINYNFIFQFKNLFSLSTCQRLEENFIVKVFKEFDEFSIKFYLNRYKVTIVKENEKSNYELNVKDFNSSYYDLHSLLNELHRKYGD